MASLSSEHTITAIDRQPPLLRRFSVLKILGQGAAGAVYYVQDRLDPDLRKFALKLLTDKAAFDENTLDRFKAELRICQSIRHPNIVEAYELIELDDAIAFTMEYVDGCDLGQLLGDCREDPSLLEMIMTQLLTALAELHRRGIVHRDVKLENILLSREGKVKLTDLGLMKEMSCKGRTRAGVLLGTAQYLPPEYIRSGKYDPRGDIYATGIALLELLTGQRRLGDMGGKEVIQHLIKTRFVLAPDELEQVPSRYRYLIERSMAVDPDKRYQSAEQMQAALRGGSQAQLSEGPAGGHVRDRFRWLITPTSAFSAALGVRFRPWARIAVGIAMTLIIAGAIVRLCL